MYVCMYVCKDFGTPLRAKIANNHIVTPNLYYNSHYPKPKNLIIGYLDPHRVALSPKP